MNNGKATGKEILELIGYIQDMVKNEYGVDLDLEQRIV